MRGVIIIIGWSGKSALHHFTLMEKTFPLDIIILTFVHLGIFLFFFDKIIIPGPNYYLILVHQETLANTLIIIILCGCDVTALFFFWGVIFL